METYCGKYAYNEIWMEARILLVLNVGSHWPLGCLINPGSSNIFET